jgi:phenylalanyl-tRNA synthetase beta chain
MLVDLEWLKTYVDIEADAKELAHRLTMSGVEVEGIETVGGETVLEVSVTPNRGDCLSLLGLAREITAVTGASPNYPSASVEESQRSNPIQIKLENNTDCPRYAARYLSGVKVGPSPDSIKRRLEASGIRSINNVVDITNYVLIEFGHPLHPFDADTIVDKTIVVRSARAGEKFVTLDGVERTLEPDMLVIADREKSVALAGIMGGQTTEVGEGTTNILLESAYFKPSSIRKTSSRLGLVTEASYRFERGCDPDNVIRALDRAAQLIAETGSGEIQGKPIDCYPKNIRPLRVPLRLARLRQILGVEIPVDTVINVLRRLGLKVEEVADKELQLSVPPFRPDLTREIDLIEEVARLYGYEQIPPTLPSGIRNQVQPDDLFVKEEQARTFMASLGFFEGINFTFTSENNFSKLNFSIEEDRILRLKNPLSAEQDLLRPSLIPSLLENLSNNLRWNLSDVKLFEISSCYEQENGLSKEKKLLAGVMAGCRNAEYWKDERKALDFYDAKGVVETFLEEFGIIHPRFVEAECAYLHPKRSLEVFSGKERLGVLGELNPICDFRGSGNVFLFELDFSTIIVQRKEDNKFQALRKFPGIARDLAIIIPDQMHASQVLQVIETFRGELLERVKLLSIYIGSPIEEGYKSMAFSLFYQSPHRTLVDEEVDRLHQRIAAHLQEELGIKLR